MRAPHSAITAAAAVLGVTLLTACPPPAKSPGARGPAPVVVKTSDTVTGWSDVPNLTDAEVQAALAEALRARRRFDGQAGQHLRARVDKEQRGGTRYDTFVMLVIAYELVDDGGRRRWSDTSTSVSALEVKDVGNAPERARRVLSEALDRNVSQCVRRLPAKYGAVDG